MSDKQKPAAITGVATSGQGQSAVGVGIESIVVTDELALAINLGRTSIQGQRKAHPGFEARRSRARKLYAEYLSNDPHGGHLNRCGMVAANLDVAARTVAKWIPNPSPTRRGRKKK